MKNICGIDFPIHVFAAPTGLSIFFIPYPGLRGLTARLPWDMI